MAREAFCISGAGDEGRFALVVDELAVGICRAGSCDVWLRHPLDGSVLDVIFGEGFRSLPCRFVMLLDV